MVAFQRFKGCRQVFWEAPDYDLGETLNSGQAFRWMPLEGGWEGILGNQWVWLGQKGNQICLQTCSRTPSLLATIRDYLQLDLDYEEVLASFPKDRVMRQAIRQCRGLRILKQPPWECLASFILSSTKQIIQIRDVVETLSLRYGAEIKAPSGALGRRAFPEVAVIASCSEKELRACRMGFRAPNLLGAARAIVEGRLDLSALHVLECEEAREKLLDLRGVGRKIADCVLLFAYGKQRAFPVDVWVARALRELYFPARKEVSLKELQAFSDSHFGHWGGYAQQYLFHYMRTVRGRGRD